MDSVIETNSPSDNEAVRRVDEVLGEGEVKETVERMVDVAVMLEEARWQDAEVAANDIGDRMDALARELDQIYRTIVTPRVEQLMELEERSSQSISRTVCKYCCRIDFSGRCGEGQ